MAFFDDIKNKALRTAQVAADKTKVMMEVARINGLIEDEKRKRDTCIIRMGEACYDTHPNYDTDAIGNLVDQINAAKEKMDELSKQANKLKGVTKCEQCGTEVVAYDKAFCSNCGGPLPALAAPTEPAEPEKTCGGCGNAVAPGMAFCAGCGQKMEG